MTALLAHWLLGATGVTWTVITFDAALPPQSEVEQIVVTIV